MALCSLNLCIAYMCGVKKSVGRLVKTAVVILSLPSPRCSDEARDNKAENGSPPEYTDCMGDQYPDDNEGKQRLEHHETLRQPRERIRIGGDAHACRGLGDGHGLR